MSHRLHTEQISLAYDGPIIINELDVSIPTGKITALVGPNGCGKSTLLRGMARLLRPKSGQVYLDGKAIHRVPTAELAKEVGILPQSPHAPEGLTVRELVAQGRYPHQSWFQQWSPDDERITHEALMITNMVDLADRPLDTLSGGQRQRAWIAMALAQETEILLLDEPTTFLDLAYQIEVLDLLHDLNLAGRTIVMVLHDLNQACRYAHHVVALHGGKIWIEGEPSVVLTAEMLSEVFHVRAHIVPDPVTGTPMCVPIGRAAAARVAVSSEDAVDHAVDYAVAATSGAATAPTKESTKESTVVPLPSPVSRASVSRSSVDHALNNC